MNNKEKEKIKKEIEQYIEEESRSLIDLICQFPILQLKKGEEYVWIHLGLDCINHLSNMVIWDVSLEGHEIFLDLQQEKKIGFIPLTSEIEVILFYFTTGGGFFTSGVMKLPRVKKPKIIGYKHPHWLPCIISTYEKALRWKKS